MKNNLQEKVGGQTLPEAAIICIGTKELRLRFSNPDISATQCCRPWLFQTMNSNRSDNLSLKNQRFTSSD